MKCQSCGASCPHCRDGSHAGEHPHAKGAAPGKSSHHLITIALGDLGKGSPPPPAAKKTAPPVKAEAEPDGDEAPPPKKKGGPPPKKQEVEPRW